MWIGGGGSSRSRIVRLFSCGRMKRNRENRVSTELPSLETTKDVRDAPCWGSADACSLEDLLRVLKESQHKSVLHQSPNYLVIDKPADLRMDGDYPASVAKLVTYLLPPTGWTRSFEGLNNLHNCSDLPGNELRHCHQLDYATSGVLLLARNKEAANQARIALQGRLAHKTYLAMVHGCVTVADTWPILTREKMEFLLEATERRYRQQRAKRRKDTWCGFLPTSSVFPIWQQQQLTQRKGKNNKFTDEEWSYVWSALTMTDDERQRLVQDKWKTVKALANKVGFAQAATRYNEISQRLHEETMAANTESLPVLFRVKEEPVNTFYICAGLGEAKDSFAMSVDPNISIEIPPYISKAGEDQDVKPSVTRCTILTEDALIKNRSHSVTKVLLEPKTGRRHQLRVHMAIFGHSIVGDQTYEPPNCPSLSSRMCLHSNRMSIPLGDERVDVTSRDPFALHKETNEILVDYF